MLTPNANTVDVNAAFVRKAYKTYVDGQLVLKADQSTTYTNNEAINMLAPKAVQPYVDIEVATKANLSEMLIALSQKHPTITSATDLTV